ncbi:hypothetical protein [Croceicoccus bisphenolivorans]|uniref:hypothetical protein n=1 Tax=Croceicoccus bisphenolivorans TaxID=1783232 RepID=UPI000829AF4E|nr:hypothetical protein [Croceicoccus bisphenolivorans]
MHDLDAMLVSLHEEQVPARLAGIDSAVMDGLAARRERDLSRRGLVLAVCLAGSVGLALGIGGGSPAQAEPLLAMPASAPSHLLND